MEVGRITQLTTASAQKPQTSCAVPGYDAKGKNRYGVDVAYFRKEFAKLSRDLDNYTPLELGRYLERLSDVALEAS